MASATACDARLSLKSGVESPSELTHPYAHGARIPSSKRRIPYSLGVPPDWSRD